jgi:hypothetical protein
MKEKSIDAVHWSFWAISVIALIWNVMGVINYVMQMGADSLSSYPESHRAIIEGRPVWATGAFATAVFAGVIGCVLLLLRKSAAIYLFVASLLGVIMTMIHTFTVAQSSTHFEPSEILLMIVMPTAVAVLLLWYANHCDKKGWIN